MYKTKIIITDNIQRYYVYKNTMPIGFKSKREDYSKSIIGEKTDKSLVRALDNFVLTVEANMTPYTKFLTLTCKDNIFDRELFLKMFNQFTKDFKREFGYSLKYLGVLEKQFKRKAKYNLIDGVWHIHLVVFNPKKLAFNRLKKIWGKYGSVFIEVVDNPHNIAIYSAKYLSKDNIEKNKKAILKSQNLKSPSIEYLPTAIIPSKITYHKHYMFAMTEDLDNLDPNQINECDMYEVRLSAKHSFDTDKLNKMD